MNYFQWRDEQIEEMAYWIVYQAGCQRVFVRGWADPERFNDNMRISAVLEKRLSALAEEMGLRCTVIWSLPNDLPLLLVRSQDAKNLRGIMNHTA